MTNQTKSLHSYYAMCYSALYCPSASCRTSRSTLSGHTHDSYCSCWQSNSLLALRHDSLVYRSLRYLAALLPFPHHRSSSREDCCRPANVIHMAAEVILQSVHRKGSHCSTREPTRARLHAHPIHLRLGNHAPMPDLVLVPLPISHFPILRIRLVYL